MEIGKAKINRLTKESTLNITICITRQFRIRLFIATTLMRAAAMVLGCGADIKTEEPAE